MKLSEYMKLNDEQKKLVFVVFLGVVISGVLITVSPRTDIPPGDGFLGFGNTAKGDSVGIFADIKSGGTKLRELFDGFINDIFGKGDSVQKAEFTHNEKDICKYMFEIKWNGELDGACKSDTFIEEMLRSIQSAYFSIEQPDDMSVKREIDDDKCAKMINEMKNTNCQYILFGNDSLNKLYFTGDLYAMPAARKIFSKSKDISYVYNNESLFNINQYESRKEAMEDLMRIVDERNVAGLGEDNNIFEGDGIITNALPNGIFPINHGLRYGSTNIYDILIGDSLAHETFDDDYTGESLLSQACYQRLVDIYGYSTNQTQYFYNGISNNKIIKTIGAPLMYCYDWSFEKISVYMIDYYCYQRSIISDPKEEELDSGDKRIIEIAMKNIIKVWGDDVDLFSFSDILDSMLMIQYPRGDERIGDLIGIRDVLENNIISEVFSKNTCKSSGNYNPVTIISEDKYVYHVGEIYAPTSDSRDEFYHISGKYVLRSGDKFYSSYVWEFPKKEDSCIADILLIANKEYGVDVASSAQEISNEFNKATNDFDDEIFTPEISVEEVNTLKQLAAQH